MNSPPIPDPKPKSALPAYLFNDGLGPKTSTRARERENLSSSIKSTYGRSGIVDVADEHSSTVSSPWADKQEELAVANAISQISLKTAARDPRDEAIPPTPPVSVSRPASPYTLNPPIDFDGLSWPSKVFAFPGFAYLALIPHSQALERGSVLNRRQSRPKSGYKSSQEQSRRYSSVLERTPRERA
jgi:hypothetical protein